MGQRIVLQESPSGVNIHPDLPEEEFVHGEGAVEAKVTRSKTWEARVKVRMYGWGRR